MPPVMSPRATRGSLALAAVRLAWGTGLVAVPGQVVTWLGGADTRLSRRIERTLGVRHLLQGAAELAVWPRWRRLGVVIDVLHAASGIGLAATDVRWRRPGLSDATITSGLALAGVLLRPGRPPDQVGQAGVHARRGSIDSGSMP